MLMKRIVFLFVASFLSLVFTATLNNQAIIVPSYFCPGSFWDNLNSAYPKAQIGIINPSNGPGVAVDPNYLTQVTESQAAGLKVLGYVATTYAGKDILATKGEIDLFVDFYPTLDGIFFDQVPTDCASIFYYLDLYSYVRYTKNMKIVIINPGIQTKECYAKAADIILSFEGSYDTYNNSYVDADWVYNYPGSLFWHVVYDVANSSQLLDVVSLSKQRNAAWIYATDDVLSNPYDTLPTTSLWLDQLSQVNPGSLQRLFGKNHRKLGNGEYDGNQPKRQHRKYL